MRARSTAAEAARWQRMCIGVATSRTSEPKTFALLPQWVVVCEKSRSEYILVCMLTDDGIYVCPLKLDMKTRDIMLLTRDDFRFLR